MSKVLIALTFLCVIIGMTVHNHANANMPRVTQMKDKLQQPFTSQTSHTVIKPVVVPKPHVKLRPLIQIGTWTHLNLTPRERVFFLNTLRHGDPRVAPILQNLATRVTITDVPDPACGPTASCADYHAENNVITDFTIHYRPEDLVAGPSERFLIWHELGHAVDYAGITHVDDMNFETLFRQSPVYPKTGCLRDTDHVCVPAAERFADQFAMFNTHDHVALTTYRTPNLVTYHVFGDRLVAAWHPEILPTDT